MLLQQSEFDELRDFIHKVCGISLDEGKQYLVESRLGPLVAEYGCASFHEFYQKLSSNSDFGLLEKLIDAMTTNESSFFRDIHPFESFGVYVLPDFIELARKRKTQFPQGAPVINIWSAACSSGQEAYSMVMMIQEYLEAHPSCGVNINDFRILGTDISREILHQAEAASYNSFEIRRGLSENRKNKFFTEKEGKWIFNESFRKIVEFKHINLTKAFPKLAEMDLILCRNVLIYFDDDTKRGIVNQFYQAMPPGGLFMIGAMENILEKPEDLHKICLGRSSYYRKEL
ncbi:MAG: protein-glutamate O-methyltransferase CheR [Planctomycetes bacterium]|nr:protein-glutamate O-methyltransferase CheR [Planctomycetota bacterium]